MSIDPKILKRMQGEDSFMQSQTKGSRRVKVERGQNWIVRFLPARMGPDGLWFARIARHWMGKVPIVCPRNTAEDFGGNPDCDCPVCLVADELNDSADEIISKFGYKAKASPQYLTYCVVWEKDGIQQPMSEILNPYEFMHYRSTFEELKGFYLAGGRKCPDSVLDYEKGNDFSVSRTGKGTRLDKLDASPIFEVDDPKYAEYIKKLEAACKTPKLVIPTDDQLQVFAHKVQAAADRGGEVDEDGPRRSRGRGRIDDDESSFRRGASRGRRTEPEEEDDLPYEDVPPSRPAARAAAAPARRSAPEHGDERGHEETPRRRPAPADDEAAPSRSRGGEDDPEPPRRRAPVENDPEPRRRSEAAEEPPVRRRTAQPESEPEPEEAPPARRPAPAPVRRSAAQSEPEPEDNGQGEPEETPPAGRRQLEPTARRQAAGAAPQGDPEEDDPLPEDDKDPVPAASKRGAAAEEDAPPPVARRGSQGADIKDRLARMPRGA